MPPTLLSSQPVSNQCRVRNIQGGWVGKKKNTSRRGRVSAPGASAKWRGNRPAAPPPTRFGRLPDLLLCKHVSLKSGCICCFIVAAIAARGKLYDGACPRWDCGRRTAPSSVIELPRSATVVDAVWSFARFPQAPIGRLKHSHEACNLAYLKQYLVRYRSLALASRPVDSYVRSVLSLRYPINFDRSANISHHICLSLRIIT